MRKVPSRSTFCVPVPVDAIAAILGVDGDRLGDFRVWSDGVILWLNPVRSPEQTAKLERCRTALRSYFHEEVERRRASPRDDFISDVVALQAECAAFGGGSHTCIGAPLARLEGPLALLKLFQRFPNLRIVESDAEPKWRTLPFFRGLEELIVRA